MAASNTIVISQVQVAGGGAAPAGDEFVELHNVGTSSVDLNGMRLAYRSTAGTTDVIFQAWSESTLIPAGGFYLLGHSISYDGPTPDATFGNFTNGEIAGAGGGLALRQGAANSGTIIDSVGYGTATNVFVEGTRTSAPANNASRVRKTSGCVDTDDNSADFEGLDPSSPRSSSSAAVACRSLALAKTITSGSPYSVVGSTIAYSYAVTSAGTLPLSGPVTIADNKATVTCPVLTTIGNSDTYLQTGETLTCTASYTVTQADITTGSVVNTATASAFSPPGTAVTSPSRQVTATATRIQTLSLVKTSLDPSYTAVGDQLRYRYAVTNTGNIRLAAPLTVADNKVSVTCPAFNTVGNTDIYLDPTESVTCAATHTVTQADLDARSVTNLATASAVSVVNGAAISSPQVSLTINAVLNEAIAAVKSSTESVYGAVGTVLHYQIEVSNPGNIRLTGPVLITDSLDVSATCPALSTVGNTDVFFDVGETMTCTATHTVTQGDMDALKVDNTATVRATSTANGATITSTPTSKSIPATVTQALGLTKSSLDVSYAAVGDVLDYSFLVSNTGNIRLVGPVTVFDDRAANERCPAITTVGNNDIYLDVGESVTCTASYTIAQSDLDAGSVTNIAYATVISTVDASTITSATGDLTITADITETIGATKTSLTADYDSVGDVISYRIVVTNSGNVRLAGPVTVTDSLDASASCPAISTVGDYDVWFDPGESITCAASYTVSQADLDHFSVSNTASASATSDHGNGSITSPDTSVSVDASVSESLDLAKTSLDADYDSVGDVIDYRFRVSNSGNVRLAGPVSIADALTADESCPALTSVGNNDAYLDVDESLVCSATYTIHQADLDRGSITNIASASADGVDSPTDRVTVDAIQTPTLTLRKSADPATYAAVGDVIDYRYRVSNSGNIGLAGPVSVADDQIGVDCPAVSTTGDGDGVLDVDESLVCSATYTIHQADLDRGSITNIASASADGVDSPTDRVTVDAIQTPTLTLRKSADPATYAAVGDVIDYRYRVSNSGNIGLAGPVSVADDQIGVDCPAVSTTGDGDGVLDVDESLVCSATYTIHQADLDRGSITNIASASADGVDSPTDRVTVDATPGLACEQTSLTFSVPKGTVTYPMRNVKVTAKGRLVDGCAFSFSLASYRTQGPTWRTSGKQVLIDHDAAILDNDDLSITLAVRAPRRYGQTVFYPGRRLYDGIDGPLPRYPGTRIESNISWSNGPRGSDTRPPKMTRPKVQLAAGRQVSLDGLVPIRSRWTAGDKRSGVAGGTIQRRTLSGTWQTLARWRGQPRPMTKWLSPSDGPFHQRVRATDGSKNTSPWKAGPWFALHTLQGDASKRITWAGDWKPIEGRRLMAGRAWRSSTPRDRLDVRIKGTKAALVATEAPWGGRVRVIIDGVKGPVIDLRSPVVRHRRIVWSSHLWGNRPHEISFVVLGRNGSAGRNLAVQIDAVLAIHTPRSGQTTKPAPRGDARTTGLSEGSPGPAASQAAEVAPEPSPPSGAGTTPGDEASPLGGSSEAASSPGVGEDASLEESP